MRALSFIALFALAGCAARQEYVWTRPGATDQEFYQDRGQCNAQAFAVPGGNLMQAVMVQNSCMQGKGWIQVPAR